MLLQLITVGVVGPLFISSAYRLPRYAECNHYIRQKWWTRNVKVQLTAKGVDLSGFLHDSVTWKGKVGEGAKVLVRDSESTAMVLVHDARKLVVVSSTVPRDYVRTVCISGLPFYVTFILKNGILEIHDKYSSAVHLVATDRLAGEPCHPFDQLERAERDLEEDEADKTPESTTHSLPFADVNDVNRPAVISENANFIVYHDSDRLSDRLGYSQIVVYSKRTSACYRVPPKQQRRLDLVFAQIPLAQPNAAFDRVLRPHRPARPAGLAHLARRRHQARDQFMLWLAGLTATAIGLILLGLACLAVLTRVFRQMVRFYGFNIIATHRRVPTNKRNQNPAIWQADPMGRGLDEDTASYKYVSQSVRNQ